MRRAGRQTPIAVSCLSALLLAPAPVWATIYDEVRLTYNQYDDKYPWIGGSKIVWQGRDMFDYEIYCYDIVTGETTEITHNVLDDIRPITDGEHILWTLREQTGKSHFRWTLQFHDIDTGETVILADGEDFTLYQTYFMYINYAGTMLDGGIAAWSAEVAGSDEVFLYDATTGETTQVTDDSLSDSSFPVVSQGRVAWKSSGYDPWECKLLVYDVSTGEIEEIHSADNEIADFDFRGNRLVWLEREYPPAVLLHQVFTHDLVSGETLQLSDNETDKGTVKVGETGIIWTDGYWVGEPYESERVTRLLFWDFQTEQTRVVNDSSVSGVDSQNPRIQQEDVVWGAASLGYQVFHHDLGTGLTTQVTHDPFTDEWAVVYDGIIVWQGYEPGSQHDEIYMGLPCLDGDGDGFEDAACGGTDCDDEDPDVYPQAPGDVPGDGVDTNCNGSDNCFIATAAFRSTMDKDRIDVLRKFRDEVLMGRPAGLALVTAYYELSPPIADYIGERPWMRALIRTLLYPVIGFSLFFV